MSFNNWRSNDSIESTFCSSSSNLGSIVCKDRKLWSHDTVQLNCSYNHGEGEHSYRIFTTLYIPRRTNYNRYDSSYHVSLMAVLALIHVYTLYTSITQSTCEGTHLPSQASLLSEGLLHSSHFLLKGVDWHRSFPVVFGGPSVTLNC